MLPHINTIDINKIASMKAIVVGTGLSGQAAVKLLCHFKAQVRILDNNSKAIESFSGEFITLIKEHNVEVLLGEHKKEYFDGFDILIPSPGAPISAILPLLPNINPPIILAETELASLFLENEKILAITGTSGKTTTTSLAEAMLIKHGLKVFTGGNIGTPLSEYIVSREKENFKADCILLELSSFQLQNCHTLKPYVAMLLNISENHLDYHKDMQEYKDAKLRIFQAQNEYDYAILGEEFEHDTELLSFIPSQKKFFKVTEKNSKAFTKSNLFGEHNILNAEAAYQATKLFGVTLKEAQEALAEFLPIEHRLEKVAEINGIIFVNDSKGTTVESLKVALNAFDKEKNPIRLLVGGKFKGGDLEGLAPLIKEKVISIICFGASQEYFQKAWNGIVPIAYEETLSKAMHKHFSEAKEKEVILLSPATSSFDQYKSYIHRGKDFKNIVKQLLEIGLPG